LVNPWAEMTVSFELIVVLLLRLAKRCP